MDENDIRRVETLVEEILDHRDDIQDHVRQIREKWGKIEDILGDLDHFKMPRDLGSDVRQIRSSIDRFRPESYIRRVLPELESFFRSKERETERAEELIEQIEAGADFIRERWYELQHILEKGSEGSSPVGRDREIDDVEDSVRSFQPEQQIRRVASDLRSFLREEYQDSQEIDKILQRIRFNL